MQKDISSDDLENVKDSSYVSDWLEILNEFAHSSAIEPHDLSKTAKLRYAQTEISGSVGTELRNLLITLLIFKSARRTKEIATMMFDALTNIRLVRT